MYQHQNYFKSILISLLIRKGLVECVIMFNFIVHTTQNYTCIIWVMPTEVKLSLTSVQLQYPPLVHYTSLQC